MAVDFSAFVVKVPESVRRAADRLAQCAAGCLPKARLGCLLHFPKIAPEIYISGKVGGQLIEGLFAYAWTGN